MMAEILMCLSCRGNVLQKETSFCIKINNNYYNKLLLVCRIYFVSKNCFKLCFVVT